jgi:hypothetical protein
MSSEIKLRIPGKRAFSDDKAEHPRLRLVSEQPSRPVGPDPELKELLDELNSRNENARAARAGRTRTLLDDIDEGPEAA